MNSIISPWVFYWIGVLDTLKGGGSYHCSYHGYWCNCNGTLDGVGYFF